MYVLVVQTGKFKGKKIKVAGSEVLIGRDDDAGIRIGSDDVSRQHCLLTPRDNGVTVRDLDLDEDSQNSSQSSTFEHAPSVQVSVVQPLLSSQSAASVQVVGIGQPVLSMAIARTLVNNTSRRRRGMRHSVARRPGDRQ